MADIDTSKRSFLSRAARLLGVVNVPSLEDFEQVKDKLEEVEGLLAELHGEGPADLTSETLVVR